MESPLRRSQRRLRWLTVGLVARLLEERIRAKNSSVLGLDTGRTMERVYHQLAASGVSFRGCASFNLDEYIGIPADDEHSYRHYMQTLFLSKIAIDLANTHVPDGNAVDLREAAELYERKIEESGGIDVQLLGIGEA